MKRLRFPPKKASGGLFNIRAFSISALELGISESPSFYLLSIANASSLSGRIVTGSLADRFGPANIMVPFTAVARILTYVWPFARSQGALIAVVLIYGFSGAYLALLGNPMIALGAIDDLGRRVGMFMSIFALVALAGPPISGAINAASGGFEMVGYFAGGIAFHSIMVSRPEYPNLRQALWS
ncbi:hypothetical protein DXG01_006444 [Tephrocybe rancida]|nr:hypothetical protein DXG01_006444 [Tephrocybe rancida]